MQPVPAYILAGGQSRRFGTDKARALYDGVPLVLSAANAARAAGHEVTIIADRPAKYADLGLVTLSDIVPGFGPLGGLFTLWNRAAQSEWALVIACDLVPIEPDWLRMLVAARHDEADAVLFDTFPAQPLLACYRRTTASQVLNLLGTPRASMSALLETCRICTVPAPDGVCNLRNINHRGDLAPLAACHAEEPS